MKILLATPINKTHYAVPPLGLGYLASALRKEGYKSVSILDSVKDCIDYEKFKDILKKGRYDILGIQCYSFDASSVKRMLAISKKASPGTITVIGGPHPTAVSEGVFADLENLDFAIKGEAEISFPLLVRYIAEKSGPLDKIPGLVYKKEGKAISNPAEFIKDIDSLEDPAWDLLDPRTYPDEVQGAFYMGFPVAPIISSRGCPYECTFCANKIMMGRALRARSVENVIKEMERLYREYGVKEFQILDDNFTMNKKRTLEFCKKFKEKGIKAHIAFPNGIRLDTLDGETLEALKSIGAYSITAGIESGSQRILDHMKKRLTLAVIKDKVKLIKKHGLGVNAFFIIGYPEETREDIQKTINFAKELPIDIAHFSAFLPLPGTEITEALLKSGRLKSIDYGELFYSKTPFSPEGVTKKELKNLQKKAFLGFYLRPRILLGFMRKIKSPRHVRSILRRAWDYIFSKGR